VRLHCLGCLPPREHKPPDRDKIECFVADFTLQRGELKTRPLLLDTISDITTGSGTINLRTETLDYQISTEAKHFTIGSPPAPISITGSFKDPGRCPISGSWRSAAGRRPAWGAVPAGGDLADYPVRRPATTIGVARRGK
jgi:hypothetical protein